MRLGHLKSYPWGAMWSTEQFDCPLGSQSAGSDITFWYILPSETGILRTEYSVLMRHYCELVPKNAVPKRDKLNDPLSLQIQ